MRIKMYENFTNDKKIISNFKEVSGKLVGNFKFKSQTELVSFLSEIAIYADKVKHHPDCRIYKAFQLEITLFTHDKNEITELDYQLANFIDSLEKGKLFEDFNKISRKVLITEIDDLLVDLTDVGFEWYFPNFSFEYKHILISIMPKNGVENNVDFKVDDTMIDCINTLVDWMREKYGIGNVSYRLSLCSGSDITTKEFSEEEFGLALYEITIILNL